MTLLARYVAAGPGPFDDRFWTQGKTVVMDGLAPSEGNALKVSTVWRAINVLAAGVAVLPVDVFRRRIEKAANGATREVSEIARELPLRNVLRLQPNKAQTSYRWRHHMMGQLLLGGNYYAQKVTAPTEYYPQQLFPLCAERMAVPPAILPDGSLSYRYTLPSGEPRTLTQDQVFHARGFSTDGITGVSVIDMMRENVSLALMNRRQRSTFVRNEMRPSVVVTFPNRLGDGGGENVQAGYKKAFAGPNKAGGILVLEEGGDIKPFQFSSRDAQAIEHERWNVEEFLRYIGVPGVLVNYPDKTATYASAESFFQSFVTHGIQPWTTNLEQELTCSLLGGDQDEYFVKFNLNALLRADSTARSAFYRVLVEMGIFTRNEIRALEDRNPIDGLDEPLTPANAVVGASPEPAPPAPAAPPAPRPAPPDDAGARARAIAAAAAARLCRREVLAITGGPGQKGAWDRFAGAGEQWQAWVADFYARHAELVAETLQLELAAAQAFANRHRDELLEQGVRALEAWGGEAERLAAIALEPGKV